MRSFSSSAKRLLQFAVLLPAIALLSGEAYALGLGELVVQSHLGSHFHAEVQLIDSAGDSRLAEECFRLSGEGEAESNIPVLIHGRLSVERKNGRRALIISSDQTINEPILQVNVRVGCGAEVVRSYTVLIDPAASPTPDKQSSTIAAAAEDPPASQRARFPPDKQESYPRVWQTTAGDSANAIAKALFPRQPSAQRRFRDALKADNPQVDLGEYGDTPLAAGTTLKIPDTRRDARSAPPANAGERSARSEDKPTHRPTPGRQGKPIAQRPEGRMADHLVISGDSDEAGLASGLPLRTSTNLSVHLSGKISESSRSMLRLEYKLLSALFVQATQQLALAEQVRNLETGLEEMRQATDGVGRSAEARSPASATSTPSAPDETSTAPRLLPEQAEPVVKTARPVPERRTPKPEEGTGWWMLVLIIVGLTSALTWALIRRAAGPRPSPSPNVVDRPSAPQNQIQNADAIDPWRDEKGGVASPLPNAFDSAPETVLADAPSTSPGGAWLERQDHPLTHIEVDETADFGTAMELAEIMIAFGRVKGATQSLEEFLAHKPDAALAPWLKLLEIYRMNDMREDFERCSIELRSHFNIAPASWDEAGDCLKATIAPGNEQDISIEELLQRLPMISSIQHVRDGILDSWGSPEGLPYLKRLLGDTRDGKRSGFPLAVARELLFLVDLLETRFQNKP